MTVPDRPRPSPENGGRSDALENDDRPRPSPTLPQDHRDRPRPPIGGRSHWDGDRPRTSGTVSPGTVPAGTTVPDLPRGGSGTVKWDVRFLNLAAELARWSSCRRDQVGAVIASPDHDVVATGFNDTPAGWANCGDGGCPRACRPSMSGSPQLDDEVCLHAEGNALQRAGLRARGAVMYVTRQPCAVCHRIALTAGIARIVVKETA